AEHDQAPRGGDRDERQLGAEHGDQGALGADEGAGQVERAAGQQLVEVVAGDPARDVGVAAADLAGVLGGDLAQPPDDLGRAASPGDDPLVLLVVGGADPHAGAVVGEDLQADHVVGGLAVQLRGGAAGVVADHAAERAVGVGGRAWAEHQADRRELPVELVQHDARLDHTGAGPLVDGDEAVAVLRPVDDDTGVAGLTGQAGAAAA